MLGCHKEFATQQCEESLFAENCLNMNCSSYNMLDRYSRYAVFCLVEGTRQWWAKISAGSAASKTFSQLSRQQLRVENWQPLDRRLKACNPICLVACPGVYALHAKRDHSWKDARRADQRKTETLCVPKLVLGYRFEAA